MVPTRSSGVGVCSQPALPKDLVDTSLVVSPNEDIDVVVRASEPADPQVDGPTAEEPVLQARRVQRAGGTPERRQPTFVLRRLVDHRHTSEPRPAVAVQQTCRITQWLRTRLPHVAGRARGPRPITGIKPNGRASVFGQSVRHEVDRVVTAGRDHGQRPTRRVTQRWVTDSSRYEQFF